MEQKLDRVPTYLTLRATKWEWKNGYPFTVGENYRIRFGFELSEIKNSNQYSGSEFNLFLNIYNKVSD